MRQYVGDFNDWKEVCSQFSTSLTEEPVYVYAEYSNEGYSGDALVLYSTDKEIWHLVAGSHCSCYGLEGQWEPYELDVKSIKKIYGARTDNLGKFLSEVLKKRTIE